MNDMFYNCTSLISLDISNFNINKVYDMDNMFHKCTSLKSLNLLSFEGTAVGIIENMFKDCHQLTSLDLSNFVAKPMYATSAFQNCYSLEYLLVPNLII